MKILTDLYIDYTTDYKMMESHFNKVLRELNTKSVEWKDYLNKEWSTPTWLMREYNMFNDNPYNSTPDERSTGYILDDCNIGMPEEDNLVKYSGEYEPPEISFSSGIRLYCAFGLKPYKYNEKDLYTLRFYIAEKIESGPEAEEYYRMLAKLGNVAPCIIEVVGMNMRIFPNVEEIIKNGRIVEIT